jgi:hypothetical protein
VRNNGLRACDLGVQSVRVERLIVRLKTAKGPAARKPVTKPLDSKCGHA